MGSPLRQTVNIFHNTCKADGGGASRPRSRSYTPRRAKEKGINYIDKSRTPSPSEPTCEDRARHLSRSNIRQGSVSDIRGRLESFKFRPFNSPPSIIFDNNQQKGSELQYTGVSERRKRRQTSIRATSTSSIDNALASTPSTDNASTVDATTAVQTLHTIGPEVFRKETADATAIEPPVLAEELHPDTESEVFFKSTLEVEMAHNKATPTPGKDVTNDTLYEIMIQMQSTLKGLGETGKATELRLKKIEDGQAAIKVSLQEIQDNKASVEWVRDNYMTKEQVEGSLLQNDQLENKMVSTDTYKTMRAEIDGCIDNLTHQREYIKHQSILITELQNQLQVLKDKDVKCNMLVFGIPRATDKENCQRLISKFIQELLKIKEKVPITNAYRLGKESHNPIQFTLSKPGQKGLLFKNVSNLKNVKNSNGKYFYLKECLAGAELEIQRWQQEVTVENRGLHTSDKLDIKISKGQLMVGWREAHPDPHLSGLQRYAGKKWYGPRDT